MEKDHVAALQRAVDIVGSQSALAEAMTEFLSRAPVPRRVSQQLISYWLKKGSLLEAAYWPAIEHATNQQVTRLHLRPDIFGRIKAA